MKNDNESSNEENMQDLVVFKGKLVGKATTSKKIKSEQVDQENLINVVNELKPHGRLFRYSLLISNKSAAPITDVKIRIKYPASFVLIRTNPPTVVESSDGINEEHKQVKMEFTKIEPNSKQQINIFLSPLDSDQFGFIKSYITFVNNLDYLRAIESEDIQLGLQPIMIEPKIIPTSQISLFGKNPSNKTAIRSIGIKSEAIINNDYLFAEIIKIAQENNFQLLTKDDKNYSAWFCGTDLVSGVDILLVTRYLRNKVEFISSAMNPFINITLLVKLFDHLSNHLIINRIINGINQLDDLECKACGTVLPLFPKRGQIVACVKCNYKQRIW
jgi:hypothetical protein